MCSTCLKHGEEGKKTGAAQYSTHLGWRALSPATALAASLLHFLVPIHLVHTCSRLQRGTHGNGQLLIVTVLAPWQLTNCM